MQLWAGEFKRDWDRSEDDPRSGSSKTSNEQVDAIHRLVLDDRSLTVLQIVQSIDISSYSVYNILNEILGKSKLPCMMGFKNNDIKSQAEKRLTFPGQFPNRFQVKPENFQCNSTVVTQNNTYVHHFHTESRIQSKQ